jgi:hypothetical protein
VRGFQELEAAELDEGMLRRASSSSRAALWWLVRKQHRLRLQRAAGFALAQHLVGHPARLLRLVGHQHQLRALAGGLVGEQVLGMALARGGDHRVARFQDRLRAAVVALQRDERACCVNWRGKSRMLRTVAPRKE